MANASVRNVAATETPKSTLGIFELPCGYLDGAGVLHTEIQIHEMTGAEQDLLSSKHMSPAQKFNELLVRCIDRIGPISDKEKLNTIVRQLPVGDRVYILLMIRLVSISDDYVYEATCPECKDHRNYTVMLSSLEKTPMPLPLQRVYEVKLPSGKTAKFRTSTGEDEEKSAKLEKDADKMSKSVLMRLDTLGGEPATLESVKAMSWKDRLAILEEFNKVEGGVDTTLETTCPACSAEFETELEVGAGFFFPSTAKRRN